MSNVVLSQPAAPVRAALTLAIAIGAWFFVILAASLAGVFATPPGSVPWPILIALTLPPILFGGLYRSSPVYRALILGADLRPLILLHTFRTLGLGFLLLAAYDILPLVFAIPAGVGDTIVAVGAFVLALSLYSPAGALRRAVMAWNAFGVADFAIAVITAVLARTGGPLHFAGGVPSDTIGTFPLVLIPAFFVPLYLITHAIVFLQLRVRWPAAERVRLERA